MATKGNQELSRLKKLRQYTCERGLLWTLLFVARYCTLWIVSRLEMHLIAIEKRRFLTGESTVASSYHTREENRFIWNHYDWSRHGEEWTSGAKRYKGLDPEQWKASVINEMMLKYIKKGSVVLEVGPGAGRWTEILLHISSKLVVADISEKALEICKNRFGAYKHVDYYLIQDQGFKFLPQASIDYIWAYDVFVHINPTDTEKYIKDFSCILKPGGVAIIHHSGTYLTEHDARESFRSYVDGRFFAHLVEKHGMTLIEQNNSLPHKPGDLISVFVK